MRSSGINLNDQRPLKIILISTNPDIWGGSEELWCDTALTLARDGHSVSALLSRPNVPHPRIETLHEQGVQVLHLNATSLTLPERIWNRLAPSRLAIPAGQRFRKTLAALSPDFVLCSMGYPLEDLSWTSICRDLVIPYALLIEQASEVDCPSNENLDHAVQSYRESFAIFFVSQANLLLLREQLGLPLKNATVVRHPVMAKPENPIPWPTQEQDDFFLACPARLSLRDKGQDILIRTLAMPKWRERKLNITFYGRGMHLKSLQRMVDYHKLCCVEFAGHTNNIEEIWRNHHACILPSRKEGLPLALVEAMWCGRTAIITDVGGSNEVLRDNATGFIARHPTVVDLDEALERAWQRRAEWQSMGQLAAEEIRKIIPADPARVFADLLLQRYDERSHTSSSQ
jgi:glycosyltransferase involved in cell wall biosynthesis